MALSRVGMAREFVSILQLMTVADWLGVGGSLATILSVLVAGYALWRQLGVLRVQLAVEHFGDHSRRFLEVMERLPEEVHDPAFCLEGRDDAGAIMRVMRTYFGMCFEEWYLHRRGYFDEGMWNLWRLGMHDALAKPAFRQAWERIASDTLYEADFKSFVATEIALAAPARG